MTQLTKRFMPNLKELLDETIPETKKVQDFLVNIKDLTLQMGVTHLFGELEQEAEVV